MQQAALFFNEAFTRSREESRNRRKHLVLLGFARLVAFLLIGLPFVFFSWPAALLIAWVLVFTAVFLFLISRYTDIRLKKDRADQRARLCETELLGLEGNYAAFGDGSTLLDPHHRFSYDMDLFGPGSFFQSLNRTGTAESAVQLADLLTANSVDAVLEKQAAVRELAQKPQWCLDFRTHQAMQTEPVDQRRVIDAMTRHTRLLPQGADRVAWVYGFLSASLLLVVILQLLPWQVLLLPFFLGLVVTGFFMRQVSKISQQSGTLAQNFRHIGETLALIESQHWEADRFVLATANTHQSGGQNSLLFAEFSKIIAALDQRNNIFFALLANGFFLWDLRQGARAEQWILKNATRVQQVFEQVNFFDAQISLGTYAFTHSAFVYPTLSAGSDMHLDAMKLGHPLIPATKCVTNSFSLKGNEFFVITGANMAGKSTFLRTVGVSLIMANAGLPVFAASFHYRPIRLISSMRSSDSLINDESYFFAELKRLKFIVDEIGAQPYFIILDEILKGTNSKDKEEGSKRFLARLAGSGSSGLIATHDLSLCELSEAIPTLKNYYFDAEIVNDELHFDYRLKQGVCQNMNASFLLRKMKIVE